MKQKGRNISATKNDFLEVLELSYKRHYNLLYNYGLKFVNDTGLIENFIQDIFIRLCKRGDLHGIDDLKIYLLRAMRNMAYDYYASRHYNLSIDEIEFSLSEDEDAFRHFLPVTTKRPVNIRPFGKPSTAFPLNKSKYSTFSTSKTFHTRKSPSSWISPLKPP